MGNSESRKQVAVVAGVGPGLGGATARRLVAAGYAVAGLARGSSFGPRLERELGKQGQSMRFYPCDLVDSSSVERAFERIESDLGAVDVLVYNAGRFLRKPFLETSTEDMRALWEINCLGGYHCARRAAAGMVERGRGCILFVGATAGVKAAAEFAAFGSAKFALRGLAQSMARELGPRGVHVAHAAIDGVIWTPVTAGWPGIEESACLLPEDVAEVLLALIRQPRSAWTWEIDLRPDVEPF